MREALDRYNQEDASRLNAESWQLEMLNLNPDYTYWGPDEDCMIVADGSGWRAPIYAETWGELSLYLDDLNEVVNFYFAVERASEDCPECGGNGYHPEAQAVVNSFYAHMNPAGEHWNDKITPDEVLALLEEGRLADFTRGHPEGYVPSAEEVNAAQRRRGFLLHDAINRMILTRTRLRRHGLPETCPRCEGHGYVFTAPAAHVELTLWLIHPRKGASRGVLVRRVERENLPAVLAFLREAADRNAARFARVAEPGTDEAGTRRHVPGESQKPATGDAATGATSDD